MSQGRIDICSHKDVAASVEGEEQKMTEGKRFNFDDVMWVFFSFIFSLCTLELHVGERFRAVSTLKENPTEVDV